MTDLEMVTLKRIEEIPHGLFLDTLEKLKKYDVNFYDELGTFNFNNFRIQCQETMITLSENDNSVDGIRYQFCDFMILVQTLVGLRHMGEFMYGE